MTPKTAQTRKSLQARQAAHSPRFSAATLEFLNTSYRQKSPTWLDRHQSEYEKHVLLPFQHLVRTLKRELAPHAPGYHFPQKGVGRVKCTRGTEPGEWTAGLYRCWVHYSAAVPRTSRFENNPNLYFIIDATETPANRVLVAGGLYHPSSRQLRAIREAIAEDASPFEALFEDPDFKRSFKGGFSMDKVSSRVPRGFDPKHPHLTWIQLQAFFVWRSYRLSEFSSAKFPDLVVRDFRQILRLNDLLTKAIQGRFRGELSKKAPGESAILDRLIQLGEPQSVRVPRPMDF